MNVIADLFPGFAEHRIPFEGAEIFVRTGGFGPPLLHGYPQTRVLAQDRGQADAAGHLGACRLARLCQQLRPTGRSGTQGLLQADHGGGQPGRHEGVGRRGEGRLLAEENSQATLAALMPLLKAHAGSG